VTTGASQRRCLRVKFMSPPPYSFIVDLLVRWMGYARKRSSAK